MLITDAAPDPEVELRRREIRYVATMLVRALCLIGAALVVVNKPPLWQLLAVVCVIAAVLLPWLAVLLANDRPPRKRGPAPVPERAVEQREHKIIDAD